MRKILDGPIQFFAEDDGGGGGVSTVLQDFGESPDVTRAPQERVEGEKPPDFTKLGGSKPPPEEKPAGTSDTPEGGKAPKKEEKPATEAPKGQEQPKKEEVKTPKTPEPVKKEEKKPEPVKKEEPKKDDPKAKKSITELTDEQIERMQPRPGATEADIKSFREMKGLLRSGKEELAATVKEREALQEEIKTLKSEIGKVPEDVDRELKELRAQKSTFLTENDPKFQEEFTKKLATSETKVEAWLKGHGAKDELIAEVKAAGIDNYDRWGDLIERIKDPIERQAIINILQARRDTFAEREERIKEIRANPEKYSATVAEREKSERLDWAKTVETKSIEISAKEDWLIEKDLPPNATEEQKKAVEEHNAAVKVRGQKWTENVRDAYNRDPEKTAELAVKALKADYLGEQVERLEVDLERAKARVAELEERAGKVKRAQTITHQAGDTAGDTPTKTPTTTVEEGKVGGSGEAAIRNFNWGKGGRK